MSHRVRLAMQSGSFDKWDEKFDGAVEVDETYIGGKARNMNAKRRKRWEVETGGVKGYAGKTGVMGFRQRGGDVVLTVMENGAKKPEMQREVRKRVKPGAAVITDELQSYRGLDDNYQHLVINHDEKYVAGQIHTNGLENFWSLLKRSLGGTYVSVRPFHLYRYLDEQAYRYNRRDLSDAERVNGVLGKIAGRRVTWKELTGKKEKPEKPTPKSVSRYPMGPF